MNIVVQLTFDFFKRRMAVIFRRAARRLVGRTERRGEVQGAFVSREIDRGQTEAVHIVRAGRQVRQAARIVAVQFAFWLTRR